MDACTSRGLVCWSTSRLRLALVHTATLWTSVLAAAGSGPHHHTATRDPFLVPPQRAEGDFDGDGRPDLAFIRDGRGGPCVVLTLTGSGDAACFDVPVTSLVQHDIDHDGDLDLVAATPSGEVLIWLNDGQGHFTQMTATQEGELSGEATVGVPGFHEPAALRMTRLAPLPLRRAETVVVQVRIRPPTPFRFLSFALSLLPAFRGPPSVAS
jgi:hypothetical protein